MKTCSACNRSDVKFHKNKSKKDGLQTVCVGCKKLRDAEYFQDSVGHHRALNKARKKKVRQWIFDYLSEHPCIDCGETDPIVLEFDHRSDKMMGISEMVSQGFGIEAIKTEAAKCDIRCSNCHKRKTAKDFGWYKDLAE